MNDHLHSSEIYKIVIGFLILVTVFSLVVHLFDTTKLIEQIGVNNSYIVLFFIALIGGVSTLSTGGYLASLYLFINSGLNFWLLGLLGGIAIFLGDLIFFQLGRFGIQILKNKNNKLASKIFKWLSSKPLWLMQLVTYVYVGFTPLPNDILSLAIGASGHTLKKFLIPLLIGSIQLQLIIAYLFSEGLFIGLIE